MLTASEKITTINTGITLSFLSFLRSISFHRTITPFDPYQKLPNLLSSQIRIPLVHLMSSADYNPPFFFSQLTCIYPCIHIHKLTVYHLISNFIIILSYISSTNSSTFLSFLSSFPSPPAYTNSSIFLPFFLPTPPAVLLYDIYIMPTKITFSHPNPF